MKKRLGEPSSLSACLTLSEQEWKEEWDGCVLVYCAEPSPGPRARAAVRRGLP